MDAQLGLAQGQGFLARGQHGLEIARLFSQAGERQVLRDRGREARGLAGRVQIGPHQVGGTAVDPSTGGPPRPPSTARGAKRRPESRRGGRADRPPRRPCSLGATGGGPRGGRGRPRRTRGLGPPRGRRREGSGRAIRSRCSAGGHPLRPRNWKGSRRDGRRGGSDAFRRCGTGARSASALFGATVSSERRCSRHCRRTSTQTLGAFRGGLERFLLDGATHDERLLGGAHLAQPPFLGEAPRAPRGPRRREARDRPGLS